MLMGIVGSGEALAKSIMNNCVQQKTKYGGGSIMVWARMSVTGRTQLVRINGNLNDQWHINEILTSHVQPFAQQVGQNFIIQQDNARAETA